MPPRKKATAGTRKGKLERVAILAWMAEDPTRALNYLATVYYRRAKQLGSVEDAPLAEVLTALATVDVNPAEKHGPVAWARRQQGPVRAVRNGRSDSRAAAFVTSKEASAQRLVRWVAAATSRWTQGMLGVESKAKELAENVATIHAIARGERVRWWGEPTDTPEQVEARTAKLIASALRRTWTPKSVAIAILRGWGVSPTSARDMVKRA